MIGKIQDVVTAAIAVSAADNAAVVPSGDSGNVSAVSQNTPTEPTSLVNKVDTTNSVVQNDTKGNSPKDDKTKKQQKMDEKSVNNMTKELNKLMSQINCNLEFQYHKEVNMMSVKMIDKATKEVLKEYPPEDMIKGMIKAKEWIGAFLDRNA